MGLPAFGVHRTDGLGHFVQVVGCCLSIGARWSGVPAGTTNVTVSIASALLSFLTMNVFAPVS